LAGAHDYRCCVQNFKVENQRSNDELMLSDQVVIIGAFGLFGLKAFAKQTALTRKSAERRN
jgi:hypothetical protein